MKCTQVTQKLSLKNFSYGISEFLTTRCQPVAPLRLQFTVRSLVAACLWSLLFLLYINKKLEDTTVMFPSFGIVNILFLLLHGGDWAQGLT